MLQPGGKAGRLPEKGRKKMDVPAESLREGAGMLPGGKKAGMLPGKEQGCSGGRRLGASREGSGMLWAGKGWDAAGGGAAMLQGEKGWEAVGEGAGMLQGKVHGYSGDRRLGCCRGWRKEHGCSGGRGWELRGGSRDTFRAAGPRTTI